MPLSSDPDRRAKQLANLRSSAAVTHGAHSGALIREAAGEHLANLKQQLPNASEEELWVQASRMAQIQRLSAFVEAKGLIRDQRKGTVFAAANLLATLSTQFERQHQLLLDRERSAGANRSTSLEAIAAELEAGEA